MGGWRPVPTPDLPGREVTVAVEQAPGRSPVLPSVPLVALPLPLKPL